MSDEADAMVRRAEGAVDGAVGDPHAVEGAAPAAVMDATAQAMPAWMRGVVALFAALFGGLAVWLARMAADAGPGAVAGSVASGALALLLLVATVRGKVWKWLWFLP